MELVYAHPEGKEYGGVDVGVGGERYRVIKEGSRQLIRGVPNSVAHLLEVHHWYKTGVADSKIVENAAEQALREQALAERNAKASALVEQFRTGAIDEAALRKGLSDLGIPVEEIDEKVPLIVARAARDLEQRENEERARAATDLSQQFLAGKLDEASLRQQLANLGFRASQADQFVIPLLAEKAQIDAEAAKADTPANQDAAAAPTEQQTETAQPKKGNGKK